MFSNKTNNLPPRPHIPDMEHLLDDIKNADLDDIAFRILNKETEEAESSNSVNKITPGDSYKQVKLYLKVKSQLIDLKQKLKEEELQLQMDNKEISRLALDIRKEAEAALDSKIRKLL
ncbi:UPF0449 protein C19orf25 homolog [Prorops nasuta]|uniref:UPF0449 protein C19orf25 homolog n=1 Tax=Prorops nasuta TaxID=863751 RepID=UPI0034CF5509